MKNNIAVNIPFPFLVQDEEHEFVDRYLRLVLPRLSNQLRHICQSYFLGTRRSVRDLANEAGLSVAAVWSNLAAVQADYLSLRDHWQPPHAAD